MEIVEQFAQSRNVAVVAPAGCGKTNLIALAVATQNTGRELILTHTHSGVFALRNRLRQLGALPSTYKVDTIAGWSLKYSAAYPALSGLTTFKPRDDEWEQVYGGAGRLLNNSIIKHVLASSYSGVYVDEYQDCSKLQHQIVLGMAGILPCRIVGDPMQSIFGFGRNQLVDWDSEVMSSFRKIAELDTPWRWKNTNVDLGRWLTGVRTTLQADEDIDLAKLPNSVEWIPSGDESRVRRRREAICRRTGETVCIIGHVEQKCHYLARTSGGLFCSMETVECRDLLDWASRLEEFKAVRRAEAVRDFAAACCTTVKTVLADLDKLLGGVKKTRNPTLQNIVSSLSVVAQEPSLSAVLPALEAIRRLEGVKLFRSELYSEMCRTLKEYSTGAYLTLTDAAWAARERTRQHGRHMSPRIVSRTLLIKGQEFDNCIVLDADSFDKNNLYVALTRGCRTLTIVSREPKLRAR